jgi:hypothetical protein
MQDSVSLTKLINELFFTLFGNYFRTVTDLYTGRRRQRADLWNFNYLDGMACDMQRPRMMPSKIFLAGSNRSLRSFMPTFLRSLIVGLAVAWWAAAAQADPVTINPNTTVVEAYNGTSPTQFFSGSPYGAYWGPNVGGASDPVYQTTGATFTWTGNNVIDIQFTTGFSGVDSRYQSQYGVTVYAADIFLKSGGGTSLPGPGGFNYAIALGFDTPDGGLSAGLYSVSSELTSQNVWGGRTQFDYGGAFAPGSSCNASGCATSELSPTVLTGGSLVGGNGAVTTSVNYTAGSGGALGTMDVTLTANNAAGIAALATVFNDSFDVFWGTGDCSNAPIWGDVTDFTDPPIPEPGSLSLLATALLGWTILQRRRRYAVATQRRRRAAD